MHNLRDVFEMRDVYIPMLEKRNRQSLNEGKGGQILGNGWNLLHIVAHLIVVLGLRTFKGQHGNIF